MRKNSCSHCAGPTCGYACSVQALCVVLSRCRQHCLSQIAGPVRYQHSLLHQNQTSPEMCMMGKKSCSHCAGLTFGYACSVQAVLAHLGMSKQQCINRTAGPVRYQHSLLPQVQTSFPSVQDKGQTIAPTVLGLPVGMPAVSRQF